jgi:hypothetical protein
MISWSGTFSVTSQLCGDECLAAEHGAVGEVPDATAEGGRPRELVAGLYDPLKLFESDAAVVDPRGRARAK